MFKLSDFVCVWILGCLDFQILCFFADIGMFERPLRGAARIWVPPWVPSSASPTRFYHETGFVVELVLVASNGILPRTAFRGRNALGRPDAVDNPSPTTIFPTLGW